MATQDTFPRTGFVRLRDILAPAGPIPVSKSTWWQGIRDGRFPKPLKLGDRASAWVESEVAEWVYSRIRASGRSVSDPNSSVG